MKIDGRQIAKTVLSNLKQKVTTPHLAIIIVGDDAASLAYVRQKEIKAKEIGIKTIIIRLPARVSEKSILKTIQQYNNNNNVRGIIVQQPLPSQIDIDRIIAAIDPKKDVDGFHPKSKFQSPLALAVLKILEEIFTRSILVQGYSFDKWLRSKKIVVLGKGETGGRPIINMLKNLRITPQIIDSKTSNPSSITKKADVIISAVGKPNVLTKEMIKKGVILISVGLSRGSDGKLHGDYDENKIKDIASFYTPELGGVGPVNVAMLLKNLINAALFDH